MFNDTTYIYNVPRLRTRIHVRSFSKNETAACVSFAWLNNFLFILPKEHLKLVLPHSLYYYKA